MDVLNAVFTIINYEDRISFDRFKMGSGFLCEYAWEESEIHVPLQTVDSVELYESLKHISSTSTEIMRIVMEMNDIEFNPDNFMLFCILHEVGHFLDHCSRQVDFLYARFLDECSLKWLQNVVEFDDVLGFIEQYAITKYGRDFVEKFCQEDEREFAIAISYRNAVNERSADKYAADKIKEILINEQ